MESLYVFGNLVGRGILRTVNGLRDICAPLRNKISDTKSQKRLILFIVCVALLLDNMLYMVIVPIITEYFKETKPPITSTTTTYVANVVFHDNSSLPNSETVSFADQRGILRKSSISSSISLDSPKKSSPFTLAPLYETNEDALTGVLFASKAIVQLMANPFTGTLIDRIGYVKPLTFGLGVMFISTTIFACAQSYGILFVARSMQGLGSALADTASLGLIADRFQDEAERSKALGIALAFISFGSLVAPPFGGVLCEFAGKEWPFLILAFVCLIDAMLLLLVQIPASDENKAKDGNIPVGTPIYKLFIDPYIAVIAISLTIANFPLAFLEPTIAKWMEETMNATKWQIGLVWLPAFLPHVLGVYLTVKLSVTYFRYQWLYGAIGLVLIGASTACVPMCKTYAMLILPLAVLCFGIALIDTALLPTLAFLVDVRHTSIYGSVYAIADISYSIAYALGPVLAGQTVHELGYLKMNLGIGLLNMMFSPLLLFLREVYDWKPDRGERITLLEGKLNHRQNDNIPSVNTDEHQRVDERDSFDSSTPHSVISYNEDEENIKTKHDPSEMKQNGEALSNGLDKRNDNDQDSIIRTTVAPRPRPKGTVTGLENQTVAKEEGDDKKYDTTTLNDDLAKSQTSNSIRNGVGYRISFEDGVELYNPLFQQHNNTLDSDDK